MDFYLAGRFQPLVKNDALAARRALSEGNVVRIYIQEEQRGPEAPFSFDQVRGMWLAAIHVHATGDNFFIMKDNGARIGARIGTDESQREKALLRLKQYNSFTPLMPLPELSYDIVKTIYTFDDDWKRYLNGSSPDLLSEPLRLEPGS